MIRSLFLSIVVLSSAALAQDTPAAPQSDEVSRQATELEAELGKFNDNTPEAAAVMTKLTDLYHQHARVFGLVRVATRFVVSHPNNPRHKAVMLKLLDGLQATSRNKDFIAYARQFLARYPDAAECAELEKRLARTLEQTTERAATADAWRAVWRRNPNANGREAGEQAVTLYASLNNRPNIEAAAALGEEMLKKLPKSQYAEEAGWKAFWEWRRISQWAKSNLVGTALLAKGFPQDKERQWTLHRYMAENYWNQSQHANAVGSIRKALAIKEDAYLQGQLVDRLYYGGAKGAEVEQAANAYAQKYPRNEDIWQRKSLAGHAYNRDGNKPRAIQIYREVLPHNAAANSAANQYVSLMGTEQAQVAAAEKVLREAIGKNPKYDYYLRYVLAFSVYRDRMKDAAKTRQTLRELVSQSPSDDGHTTGALSWLFSQAPDDAAFQQDVKLAFDSRLKHAHIGVLRSYPLQWVKSVRKNKDLKDRAAYVSQQIAAQKDDQYLQAWSVPHSYDRREAVRARARLLEPDFYKRLSDVQAERVLSYQAYYYRHRSPRDQRDTSAKLYAQLAARFPQNYEYAAYALQSATDYAQPEVQKLAAEHLLKFDPPRQDTDAYRRLMIATDQNKDAALAKKSFAWITKSEAKFGKSPHNSAYIGDILAKYEMQNEAKHWWRAHLDLDGSNWETYTCADRLLAGLEGDARKTFLAERIKAETDYHGRFAQLLAYEHLKTEPEQKLAADSVNTASALLQTAIKRQAERGFRNGGFDDSLTDSMLRTVQPKEEVPDDVKQKFFVTLAEIPGTWGTAAARLVALDRALTDKPATMADLLEFQTATWLVGNGSHQFDIVMRTVQSVMTAKRYHVAATLLTGMLSNIGNVESGRLQRGRDLVAQTYSRMGAVGLTIDENSPIAPLLQAALYLRLGDRSLALETYTANKKLFNEHRTEVPVDLLLFVCENHVAAGGDENFELVEDVLRTWLVKNSESKEYEDADKAQVQLLLAKNFFKGQRYDVARSEYQTVINRYADSPQAIEAEFGIGETFMAQKVYDQAETVFQKLAASRDADVTVRAEFLRGVLAYRRGDKDEARDIFRGVLDRVPNVGLANQALFNLASVYGDEERYVDQLNLLQTVGRLGRASKRWHRPGQMLSIVVQDSDLGISRGHNKIPVHVRTEPGGDEETIYLTSGGAGKGLFRADLDTKLGEVNPKDGVLQLTGRDVITCDYPESFKQEFKHVALADAEIKIASDAEFKVASSKIVDEEEETFSERLTREQREDGDQRVSQQRPNNQIKPGNPLYFRTVDPDRDLTSEADKITVKLTADSGDQVQVELTETEPHSGVFEGTAKTSELPAGALASDTAIEHSPLMAIDKDPASSWISEPDGATPKWLTVDMKDLKDVSRVSITTPNAEDQAPVRGKVLGSNDGLFWFYLAGHPKLSDARHPQSDSPRMKRKLYRGNYYAKISTWDQVLNLADNTTADEEGDIEEILWSRADEEMLEEGERAKSYAAVWTGTLVQERDGAARIAVQGYSTGLAVDGRLEMPVARGSRHVDVWLTRGAHTITVFATVASGNPQMGATLMRSDHQSSVVRLHSFRRSDFDLTQPAAKIEKKAAEAPQAALTLAVGDAKLDKKTEQFGLHKSGEQDVIGYWHAPEDTATWQFQAPAEGRYHVMATLSHQGGGSRATLVMGDQSTTFDVPNTGNWKTFIQHNIGTVEFDAAKAKTLTIKPEQIERGALLVLKDIAFVPVVGESVLFRDREWAFQFESPELRFVRFEVDEYRGAAVAVSNVEVSGKDRQNPHIPTETDVLSLSKNETLEIAGGDVVTATYTDELTQRASGGSRLLAGKMTATYFNAAVTPIGYEFVKRTNGVVDEIRKELMRIDPGERLIVEIVDYDQDRTNNRDTVEFEVSVNDGAPVKFKATETEEFSGVFTKEVDTGSEADDGKLAVKAGDRIFCRYLDEQNTFPGHSVTREGIVYVITPSDARLRVLETRVTPPPEGTNRPPRVFYAPPADDQEVSGVAFEAPLTVEVIDPDAARDSMSSVTVTLTTTDGATVDVECVISPNYADASQRAGQANWPLRDGRFVGQVIMQLGGKDSPVLVPLSANMPRNLTGGPKVDDETLSEFDRSLVTKVMNLTGKDVMTAAYKDERRSKDAAASRTAKGRLISNGSLACVDREYENELTQLHVGEKLYLMVTDADGDTSDSRDFAEVEITTEHGEKETVRLEETLNHSGVFTGSLTLKANEQPTPGNLNVDTPVIETYFGDKLTVHYQDKAASTESGTLDVAKEIPVVIGTDGLVAAFSKTFKDEKLAVETKFHIAESYFELFKSHKKLARKDEQTADLEAGRRVLTEVMEDYPDPKYVPRIAYLLGQFSQELEHWDEAIDSYEMIVRQYPEHSLAPDAQYKLAQAHEEAGNFNEALEAYVTLAATYPKNPLIANVMIRISDHFYKNKSYDVAAQVGEKFLEKFESHEHASRMGFRIGQCHYKAEKFRDAGAAFDRFSKVFPEAALGPDAMFWAGESYRMAKNNRDAFRRYNKCRWDYPESEAAKFARGRLALPEMLQQFEADANSIDTP